MNKEKKILKCHYCPKELTSDMSLEFHELYQCEQNKSTVECKICKARKRTQDELNLHYYEIHLSQKGNFQMESYKTAEDVWKR